MAPLANIVACQWRAYWRRFVRGRSLSVGNQGLLLIIALLVFAKYVSLLRAATIELSQGNTRLAQSLLTAILVTWLLLPLAAGDRGVLLRRTLHLPLSRMDLFALGTLSLLISPLSWITVAASLAIIYPMAHAPNGVAAIIAASCFLALSGSAGLAMTHLVSIAAWRRVLFTVVLVLCVPVYYMLSGKGLSGLSNVSQSLPAALVARASVGDRPIVAIGWLVVLALLSIAAAWLSFRKGMLSEQESEPRRGRVSPLLALPGAAGSLAVKEFRYFRKLLDPYLGLAPAVLCCFYLWGADGPSTSVVLIFTGLALTTDSPLAFNSFGLDTRAGLDRLALLPATGAMIIHSKNLAYMLIVGVQMCPIIIMSLLRLGLSGAAVVCIAAASSSAVYLTWGNWMSVAMPRRMQFFRFAPASGSILEIIGGMVLGSFPVVLLVFITATRTSHTLLIAIAVFLICGLVYYITSFRAGNRFEHMREEVVRRIC